MVFKRIKKRSVIAGILASATFAGIGTTAFAERYVVEQFKPGKTATKKTQELWDNRPFDPINLEYLDRGLVAAYTPKGIFVSWRWLGTESYTTKYNLYRDGEKINAFPLNVTNFTDTDGSVENTYQVAAVIDGVEQEKCEAVTPWESNKKEIDLTDIPQAVWPDGSPKLNDDGSQVLYYPNECSIADCDGDGELDIILKWEPDDRQDNSINGYTSPTIIDAYKTDGTRMWRINMGYNIRSGAHYVQFMVADFDGDGKAEMFVKTSDGTTDNEGNVVGDPNAYWIGETGRALDGPEYVTAFDCETGTIIDTAEFIPGRGNSEDWGDNYGNRVDRFLGGIAHLGGDNPSCILSRGYYTRSCVTAYDLVDGKIQMRWAFDTDDNLPEFMGQGSHSLCTADVDYDGKDEVIYGASVIDDDGTGLYSVGLGHGDAQHTSDLVPDHPGLETFSVHEHSDAKYGIEMRDARTGEFLWAMPTYSDVGRGVSADIDPNHDGAESWAEGYMFDAWGNIIATNPSISCNFLIYWDGDLGREVQDSNHIDKWIPEKNKTKMLFSPKGYVSFGGTKAPPGITCDMLGDWREETILFSSDRTKMAIFTTTEPTDYKIYTLMHDTHYRNLIASQNSAYNQPTHVGFNLSYTTTEIPASKAQTHFNGETYFNPDIENGIKFYPIESLMREESLAMVVDEPYALKNGGMIGIDSDNAEVAPFVADGRTLVPMRFIAEAFGATVDWNDVKKEVTIKKDKKTIKMKISSNSYTIGRQSYELDVPAQIYEDRTFVPLRAIAEALDKKVAWDKSGVIYINNETEKIPADSAAILYKSITNYIAPNIEDVLEPLNPSTLSDKAIPIYEVDALTNDGNIAEGAIDGDFNTRWNGYGDNTWLDVDFATVKEVAGVGIAFFKGDNRKYYFDIQCSDDGENWTDVVTGLESSGSADPETLEMFIFPSTVKARYLRYLGHMSSDNDANNIYEFVPVAP
ncbi:MAG: stalk domain-containing protein [Clostridia bacterium]